MKRLRPGLTLVELLVTLSVMSVLFSILLPTLGKVRNHSRSVQGLENQRQIVTAVNQFALDHRDRYPDSVATIGVIDTTWNWQEPMMLTGYQARSPRLHRSLSAYLRTYLKDAALLACPSAPAASPHLQKAWDAGDRWDNPDTPPDSDPLIGTWGFYWNYIGHLPGRSFPYVGPRTLSGGRGQSKLLTSDYLGYDHWRSPATFGSCERFDGAAVTPGTEVSSDFWSRPADPHTDSPDNLTIRLRAGYTDGHVETYLPAETVPMQVAITANGDTPYPTGAGPGTIYLPRNAFR